MISDMTNCPSLGITGRSCLELEPPKLSPFNVSKSTGVFLVKLLFRQPYWRGIIHEAWSFLGESLTAVSWSSVPYNLSTHSSGMFPGPEAQECSCRCSHSVWESCDQLFSAFESVMVFCKISHLSWLGHLITLDISHFCFYFVNTNH